MAKARRTSDFGTVVLHAALVVSWLVVVATGLRIATDDPATPWLAVLDPLLPSAHLWYRHLVAGAALTAVLAGYFFYILKARLTGRVRIDRARIASIRRHGPARWGALAVLVHWTLIVSLVVLIGSGIALFAGWGAPFLAFHREATFVSIAAIVAHVGLHAAQGGLAQLLRVIRPAPLVVSPPAPDLAELLADELARRNSQLTAEPDAPTVLAPLHAPPPPVEQGPPPVPPPLPEEFCIPNPHRTPATLNAHPLASALALAVVVAGLAVGAEQSTRPVLRILGVSANEVPVLDGDISDRVWARAPVASVLTTQGGDFGGRNESFVEIRAVHDGVNAYFAIVWDDPTRSLKHRPLVKRDGKWFIAASRDDLADEQQFHEDKFAVLLANAGLPLIGAAIHLARQPLGDKPPSSTGRGLHYTTGGGIADLWQWRASHGGLVGHIDNGHFGSPVEPRRAPGEPVYQYPGGFGLDPGPPVHESNVVEKATGGGPARILPRRLPKNLAATAAAMGLIGAAPGESESEGARWWMLASETIPYSPEADAAIPDGTVLPGIVFADHVAAGPSSIRGTARWAAGRWTLELARRLYTGSPTDVPIKSGNLLWVAAFDHAEKRHTRHLRPFRLEMD